jgi:hypothetical protein
MVAEMAQGVGRSWIKRFLEVMLAGHVNTASIPQLFGKDNSQFNDWLAKCLFLVCEESKAGDMTPAAMESGYNFFKTICDTAVAKNYLINPKYERQKREDLYFNVLIFSNSAEALPLPPEDRRVYVIKNPDKRNTQDYYERLESALSGGEPMRAYNWLMQRDVSKFNHTLPPMTEGKATMIQETRSPGHVIMQAIEEGHGCDLVTIKTLKNAVIAAASNDGFDKIVQSPGGVTRWIWRKIGTLRADDPKNGARYLVGGKMQEIRAIRMRKHWAAVDSERDAEEIKRHFSDGETGSIIPFTPKK